MVWDVRMMLCYKLENLLGFGVRGCPLVESCSRREGPASCVSAPVNVNSLPQISGTELKDG